MRAAALIIVMSVMNGFRAELFGLSVAISFVYYGVLRAGQALGHYGALPPYVAAWMGDVVFGGIGLFMMAQAQRR